MSKPSECRKAFEAELLRREPFAKMFFSNKSGKYTSAITQFDWEMWQVSWNIAQEELRQQNRWLLAQVTSKMPNTAFICGTIGKEIYPNLYEGFLVCCAYGADATQAYVLKKRKAK